MHLVGILLAHFAVISAAVILLVSVPLLNPLDHTTASVAKGSRASVFAAAIVILVVSVYHFLEVVVACVRTRAIGAIFRCRAPSYFWDVVGVLLFVVGSVCFLIGAVFLNGHWHSGPATWGVFPSWLSPAWTLTAFGWLFLVGFFLYALGTMVQAFQVWHTSYLWQSYVYLAGQILMGFGCVAFGAALGPFIGVSADVSGAYSPAVWMMTAAVIVITVGELVLFVFEVTNWFVCRREGAALDAGVPLRTTHVKELHGTYLPAFGYEDFETVCVMPPKEGVGAGTGVFVPGGVGTPVGTVV